MKILEVISNTEKDKNQLKRREAVRGVVFVDKKIPLIMQSLWNGYKLPGGGMEIEESQTDSLKREFREEIGISIIESRYVGSIEEIQEEGIYEISHCYLGRGKRDAHLLPTFEGAEKKLGSEIIYVDFNSAIRLLASSRPTVPRGLFIIRRDLRFLREAKTILEKTTHGSKV